MKTLFSFSLILTFAFSAFAQSYVIMVKPSGNRNWGYCNLKGEMIIPAQFGKCYQFADGLALVNERRQWDFINIKGERIKTDITNFEPRVGPLGSDLFNFSDGLIPIRQGRRWGYLNNKGKLIITAKYDAITEFNGGFATVQIGRQFIVVNTSGKETIINDAGIVDVKEFSDGLAPFQSPNRMFGFIGTNGKIAIKAQFESVGYFNDGLAWAKVNGGKLGYIDTKGEWVIKPQYDIGKPFDKESGMAKVKTGVQWFYINKSGTPMYVSDTQKFGDFTDGLAMGERNRRVGFYDNKGKWDVAPELDDARDFNNGYAAAKRGNKWGVIDKKGKWVIEPIFDGIKDVQVAK